MSNHIMLGLNFDGKALAAFTALAKAYPREMVRANGRAASIVKRKMRAELKRGGGKDIPSFAPLSTLSREVFHRTRLGGILSEPHTIVSYKRGADQIVGWVDGLEATGAAFQKELFRPTEAHERRYIHRAGASHVSGHPATYYRPARPVIEPLMAACAPDYPKWFMGAAEKLIEKSKLRALKK